MEVVFSWNADAPSHKLGISNYSRILPRFFLKIENFPEFAIFGQFQHIGHHFHIFSVTESDFALRLSDYEICQELS